MQRYGGWLGEEFLPQLQGRRGVKIYREMSDNDPTIGALLFVIDMFTRRVTWQAKPESESFTEDKKAADFVTSCIGDMSHSWPDFISEASSKLRYGWSLHEICYKQRAGDNRNPALASKFSDGLYGWKKLPIRGQDTLWEWKFDDNEDEVVAMEQWNPYASSGRTRATIPLSQSLLFRTSTYKNNPEGRSILRNAYRPWLFKKRIEELEGIGYERWMGGVPMAEVPPELLDPKASADDKATLEVYKKIATGVRRDSREGIVWPLAYTDGGQKKFNFSLLSSGGGRPMDASPILDRLSREILSVALASWIMLGHGGRGGTGSYALSNDQTNMFELGIDAWLQMDAAVLNKDAVPPLLRRNGMTGRCSLVPGRVDRVDLQELGLFLSYTSGAGFITPDFLTEQFLRGLAKMPFKEGDAQTPKPDGATGGGGDGARGRGGEGAKSKNLKAAAIAKARQSDSGLWLPFESAE